MSVLTIESNKVEEIKAVIAEAAASAVASAVQEATDNAAEMLMQKVAHLEAEIAAMKAVSLHEAVLATQPVKETETPTFMKTFAVVKARDIKTGEEIAVKNKFQKTIMSPPAAYNLAKRYKANPLTKGYDYRVELVRLPEDKA